MSVFYARKSIHIEIFCKKFLVINNQMFASNFALALFAVAASASENWGGYNGHNGYRGYYGYNGHPQAPHHPAPHHGVNPWAQPPAAPAVDKSGWFNEYQQYSDPWRVYEPVYNPHPVMAICNLESGNVQIAQLTGQAAMVKADLSGLEANTGYRLRVREFGNLGNTCKDGGEEFNPLKEMKYGV